MAPETPPPHAVEASTARADALKFLRTYLPESLELLDAQTEDAAADRLLALRALPYGDQNPKVHEARRTRYNEAEKKQTIPGLRASLAVSTALFLLVLAGAAAFLIVAWGAFGTDKDLMLFAPEWFGVLPAIELLLLAPTALVPLYLLFIVSVHWRARTHGRAVLRVARADGAAQRSGIPDRSPFHGIWSSWASLGTCLQWSLAGYFAVAVIAWMTDARDAVPVVIAYAVPVAVILLPRCTCAPRPGRDGTICSTPSCTATRTTRSAARGLSSTTYWKRMRRSQVRGAGTLRTPTGLARSLKAPAAPSGGRASQPVRPRRTISSIQSGANGEVQFGGVG